MTFVEWGGPSKTEGAVEFLTSPPRQTDESTPFSDDERSSELKDKLNSLAKLPPESFNVYTAAEAYPTSTESLSFSPLPLSHNRLPTTPIPSTPSCPSQTTP